MLILKVALEHYDLMINAREEILRHGFIVEAGSGGVKDNPALRAYHVARTGFLEAWKALNLSDAEKPRQVGRRRINFSEWGYTDETTNFEGINRAAEGVVGTGILHSRSRRGGRLLGAESHLADGPVVDTLPHPGGSGRGAGGVRAAAVWCSMTPAEYFEVRIRKTLRLIRKRKIDRALAQLDHVRAALLFKRLFRHSYHFPAERYPTLKDELMLTHIDERDPGYPSAN